MPRTPRQSSTPRNKPMATGITVPRMIQIRLWLSALHSRESARHLLIVQETDELLDRLGAIPLGQAEVDRVEEGIDDEKDVYRQRRQDKGVARRVIAQLAVGEELADAVGHVSLSRC